MLHATPYLQTFQHKGVVSDRHLAKGGRHTKENLHTIIIIRYSFDEFDLSTYRSKVWYYCQTLICPMRGIEMYIAYED